MKWAVTFKKCQEPAWFHVTYQAAKAAGMLNVDAKGVALVQRLQRITGFDDLRQVMEAKSKYVDMVKNAEEAKKVCSKESGKNKRYNLDERDCRDVVTCDDSIACYGRGASHNRSVIAARSNCSSYSCPVPKEQIDQIAKGVKMMEDLLAEVKKYA